MADPIVPLNPSQESKLISGVAGGSGGTLLILLAQNLPDSNPYKSWLMIVAPFASVAVNNFWIWTTPKINAYLEARKKGNHLAKARKFIMKELQDPITSEERRVELKKQLEKINQLEIDDSVKVFRTIRSD